MKLVKNENNKNTEVVTDEEAREAFVKILKWLGEDPSIDGSSPSHFKILTNASRASSSVTTSVFLLFSFFTNFMMGFYIYKSLNLKYLIYSVIC